MSIVEHIGKVVEVYDTRCLVQIEQMSACVSCQVKSACTVSEKEDKLIEVFLVDEHVKVGEQVLLIGQHSLGLKAVFFAYVLPLLVMFTTLVLLTFLNVNETLSGTIVLCSILPYYGILHFFKDRFKRKFAFKLTKLNS